MLPVVLAIDDSPEILQTIGRALGDDLDLRVATNADDGLALALESKPDLILLDIMMPVLDGIEVARQLKASDETKHIPIVMLTAAAQSSMIEKAMSMGAAEYIAKPFDPEDLEAVVERVIASK